MFVFGGLAYNSHALYTPFFATAILFFVRQYLQLKKREVPIDARFLVLMAYALPFSWRNFIGGSYSTLPVSWFYILGLFYVIAVLTIQQKAVLKQNIVLAMFAVFAILISIVPIFYSNQADFTQSITQLVVLTFNNLLICISILRNDTLDKRIIKWIGNAYTTGAVFTSLMLIAQYALYQISGFQFGYMDFLLNRELFYFLFADISHGTLYLATAAFWLLYSGKDGTHNIRKYGLFIVIAVGSAVTSARTGLVILFIFTFFFILIEQKGLFRKILALGLFGISGYYAFQVIQKVRNLTTVADLTNGSGRLSGYASAFDLFKKSPFLGYGYGQNYLSSILGQPIPHLSILQYALHGGILLALILFMTQFLIWFNAVQKRAVFSWLLAMVLVGTCLVPDLFATRFITMICLVSITYRQTNVQDNPIMADGKNIAGVK